MIPIKYNIRNLRVRWVSTLMTVLGTGLVVAVTVTTIGFGDALATALRVTGDPLDLLVLRQGSNDETGSSIDAQVAKEIANLEGIARDENGQPLCSSEFVTILTKPRRGNGGTTNLIVRGIEQSGRLLRPHFQVVEGRDVRPGVNEAITSRVMAERFLNLAIGEKLEINKVDFSIVGYFEAGGSAAESEVWTDSRDLTSALRIPSSISTVNLRATDDNALESLIEKIEKDERFKMKVVKETKYFEDQMVVSIFMRFIGFIIGGFLTVGAMFAAANTMYSAVASRSREIGTLRALGFSRASVLFSFLTESMLLCTMGGLLGCLGALPFSGVSGGTSNMATFSEITYTFRFTPTVFVQGVSMAVAMGLMGGLFPAIRAVRLRIIDALRQS